jgi:hypothetical protein
MLGLDAFASRSKRISCLRFSGLQAGSARRRSALSPVWASRVRFSSQRDSGYLRMITAIDEERGEVVVRDRDGERKYPLASAEGFAAASRAWLRAGWDAKYVYGFTW